MGAKRRSTSPNTWSKSSYSYIRIKAPSNAEVRATCVLGTSYYGAISLTASGTSSNSNFRMPTSTDDTVIMLMGNFTTSSTITFYASSSYSSGTSYAQTYTPSIDCNCLVFRFQYSSSTSVYW